MGKFHEYHVRRAEDIELLLPSRMKLEPKPGDNPLHRPYPEHARDMEILAQLLAEVNAEPVENTFTERDKRIPIRPHGVLFFHAMDIQNLVLSRSNFAKGSQFCVYVELECQDTFKCSDPVYCLDCKKVRIDHSVHIFIELSEFRMDDRNEFFVHIYAFQDPEHHHLIGSQKIHMFDFIREMHGISSLSIINELSFVVGKFTFEFAWAYGSFGYGFSNQLCNMKVDPFENICHSMFPRIKLSPSDLVDNKVNTRIPKTLRLVTLHSLLLRKSRRHPSLESTKAGIQLRKSHLSRNKRPSDGVSGTDYEAKTLVFRRVKFCRGTPIHVSLNLDIHQKFMEDDFNTAYGEYICLRNRRDRLTWLTKLTEGRLRDKLEYDTMELFKPSWTAREARRTLSLKRPLGAPPNLLEHVAPQRNKQGCRPIGRSLVEEEDLQFVQNKLASAPRTSGYLEYVFGYRKPPPEDADLKNFEFKVDPKAAKEAGQVVKDVPTGCRKAFLYLGGWFFAFQLWLASMYELIFPSFERVTESQLPEISLTMPSPEHSTTDFHSFCTQKQVFDKETDLDKARRRASAYIQLSRRARKPEIDLEDFEEFLVPSEAFVGEMTKQRKERNSGEDKESKLGNNSPPKK